MAWTLLMTDEEGRSLPETFVLLDDELVEYFAGLEDLPAFRAFQDLDPAKDTWIDAGMRERLEREVAELAARARRREGPEPPEWVGLEGTGDIRLGEELGWKGLLDLLQRLAHLLHLARSLGLEVWALPDD
jgi:hypothetical protein